MGKWNKILNAATGLASCLAFVLLVHFILDSRSSLGSKAFDISDWQPVQEASSRPLKEPRKPSRGLNIGLSDSMLVDSILNIIQNYYVDETRVGNRELMQSTLRSLHEQDLVQLSFNDQDGWAASRNSDKINLKLDASYSYDELMRDSLRLVQLLEKHKTQRLPPGRVPPSGSFLFLNAMLAGLDPHSNLLAPEEYRDLRQGTEGSFGGLGVVVGMQEDVLTVIKPLPKSPASRAGVAKSDRIMQIDSKSTFGTTLEDLIQYMRGDPGTRVNLFVLREGDMAPRKLSLMREVIQVDSVESRLISSDVGNVFYASIDSFSSRTAAELRDALLKAQQQNSQLAGVILDLRSNPGGLLDQAVRVADLFLDEGRIVSTQGRSREYEVAKQNLYRFDYPIVILSNGDTASASEIVAGALRDHGRALVVGEPSFGKGSVQTVFELPGDQALKLTIARYYTPRGTSIQNVGIMPDIWLQPVYPIKGQSNLLGEYRYKSERFLDHSLDQEKLRAAGLQAHEWKAFYLNNENSPKAQEKDVPLNFALRMMEDLSSREGIPLPLERLRSSYWKASSSKQIRKMLRDLNRNSELWLSRQKRVDWAAENEDRQLQAEKKVRFTIDLPDRLNLKEGQAVQVPWRIVNASDTSLSRLSVFVTGNHDAAATTEILIGKLPAGQELQGTLTYELKIDAKESPIRLRAGLARSGWPLVGKERSFWLELQENPEPQYDISLQVRDGDGGRLKGVLEAGESAEIELRVRNISQIVAQQVEAKLVNLAGKQVQLSGPRYKFRRLAPGESKIMKFSLKASADLASNQLQFGVLVGSDNQLVATKSHFYVSGEPGTRVSKSDVNAGGNSWKEN